MGPRVPRRRKATYNGSPNPVWIHRSTPLARSARGVLSKTHRKGGTPVSLMDVSTGTAYAGREANHALSFRQFNQSKHAQYFTPVWLAELLFEAFNPLMPPE